MKSCRIFSFMLVCFIGFTSCSKGSGGGSADNPVEKEEKEEKEEDQTSPVLESLKLIGASINPDFDKETTEYVVTHDFFRSKLPIEFSLSSKAANIQIGNETFKSGEKKATFSTNSKLIELTVSEGELSTVYKFTIERQSAEDFAQNTYFKLSDRDDEDYFGDSVSAAGDILVVGTPYDDSQATGVNGDESDNSESNSGAVFVFRKSGETWAKEAFLGV